MTRRWTRRAFLAAGLAVPLTAAAQGLPGRARRASPLSASARRAAGFPVLSRHFRGDSSIASDLFCPYRPPIFEPRPGPPPPPPPVPPNEWAVLGRSLARFRDLRRHFVFEYYPWYGAMPYQHWNEDLRRPPVDIAASSVPLLGAYDSGDVRVIEQHARWIAESGAGAINLSWWGRDDVTDRRVHRIMDVMRAHDIHVTFHFEPYADDRVDHYASDVMYVLHEYGVRRRWDAFFLLEDASGRSGPVFKSFRSILPPAATDRFGVSRAVPDFADDDAWRRQTDQLRDELRHDFDRLWLLGDSLDTGRTAACGFDGVAVYDAFVRPAAWSSIAGSFTDRDLLFSFNINSGFDKYPPRSPEAVAATPFPFEPPVGEFNWTNPTDRLAVELAVHDRILESARTTLAVQASEALANARRGFLLTYINSFNEWHEGSSFEPAKDYASLTHEERAIGYHNPTNGYERLNLLASLVGEVQAGAAGVAAADRVNSSLDGTRAGTHRTSS